MATSDGVRIKETTTTTGTGDLTLLGAASTYRGFSSVIADNTQGFYNLFDADGIHWEVGIGTLQINQPTSPNIWQRTTVIASNYGSNARIPLTSGTHTLVNAPTPGYLTGDVDGQQNTIDNCNFSGTFAMPLTSVSSVSGVLTLDLSKASFQVTLTENTTLAFTNWPANNVLRQYRLFLFQDSVGGHTLTLPSSVLTAQNAALDYSLVAGKDTVIDFFIKNGSTIRMLTVGKEWS